MRIFLTGATGFLGTALIESWRDDDVELGILLRESSVFDSLKFKGIKIKEYRYSDINEIFSILNEFKPNFIINSACLYGRENEHIHDLVNSNFLIPVTMIDFITLEKMECTFINTNTCLEKFLNNYSLSKHHILDWAKLLLSNKKKLNFINLEIQQMYGPGDTTSKFPKFVIDAFAKNISELDLTDCLHKRDFIYIDDVVNAFNIILKQPYISGYKNYEIGSGKAVELKYFVKEAHKITKSKTSMNFGKIEKRLNEPEICEADINEISKLGWRPSIGIQEGINRIFNMEY